MSRSNGWRRIAVALALLTVTVTLVWAPAGGAITPVTPRLHATPAHLSAGGTVVLHGSGFPASAHIVLRAEAPGAKAKRIGEARTGLRGGFVAPVTIDDGAATGVYVASACQARCKVKATARFRVQRPH